MYAQYAVIRIMSNDRSQWFKHKTHISSPSCPIITVHLIYTSNSITESVVPFIPNTSVTSQMGHHQFQCTDSGCNASVNLKHRTKYVVVYSQCHLHNKDMTMPLDITDNAMISFSYDSVRVHIRFCLSIIVCTLLAFHFQGFHSYVGDASYFACMDSSDNRALIRPIQFIIACFNRYAFMEVYHHLNEAFNVLCLSDLF
eukprot:597840_1